MDKSGTSCGFEEVLPKESLFLRDWTVGGRWHCVNCWADMVEFPDGKVGFTGVNSLVSHLAREIGFNVKVVRVSGCCTSGNVVERASNGFPVWVEGKLVTGRTGNMVEAMEVRIRMSKREGKEV